MSWNGMERNWMGCMDEMVQRHLRECVLHWYKIKNKKRRFEKGNWIRGWDKVKWNFIYHIFICLVQMEWLNSAYQVKSSFVVWQGSQASKSTYKWQGRTETSWFWWVIDKLMANVWYHKKELSIVTG